MRLSPFSAFCLATICCAADTAPLLHPKSLNGQKSAQSSTEMRQAFADPPAQFRPMPLWVWNDDLSWPRLQEQLRQFKEQGIGGPFVHPRPGLMTEYLSAEWFRLWGLSIEESKRLGLLINIYDENSYPSGFAGGHVPARAPDTVGQFVYAEPGAGGLATFALEKLPDGTVKSATRIDRPKKGQASITFRLQHAHATAWNAGFPYVDLTNPNTAPVFLETTHEAYKKHFGAEFGKTVRWIFTDEPRVTGSDLPGVRGVPLSYNTLAEFKKRCGYDLTDNLPSLFWDVGDYRKVRFDYWQTIHDLFKENYWRQILQWCDRNHIQFTGHAWEHDWPMPWNDPGHASTYAWQHMPGIDWLAPQGIGSHLLFTVVELASVANQLGRRAFCEAYGVGGWDATFEDFKKNGDWLLVHGIDFIDQHLAYSTVRGARKRDHPQSFSDVSPWWPYYRLHADHIARVSYALSQGAANNRLLVLEPTTSGFLLARREGQTPELTRMREDNGNLIQSLADHHVDFDLGDEYILEWFGSTGLRPVFTVGNARYDLLVWPANMINLRKETLPLLERYLAAGGEILALSPPAAYIDGRSSDRVQSLASRYASQWHTLSGTDELLSAIRARLKPRIAFDPPEPRIHVAERNLETGEHVLFFTNSSETPAQTNAILEGGAVESWDTVSGKIQPAAFTVESGRVRFPLDLAPAGSALFVVKKTGAAAPAPQPESSAPLAGSWTTKAEAPNVLVLDYCDLKLAGAEQRDINTWRANWNLWQAHGFERDPWDSAVQFRTRVFDLNHFGAGSGFEATFHFDVTDSAALKGMELALESPELYRVLVNGNPVPFRQSARWLDPHIKSVAIEKTVRVGENTIQIVAHPFDVKMELEPVYIRGSFSVTAGDRGFRLGAPVKLDFGSWSKQGYPFYGASVLYNTQVDAPTGRLRVELGTWTGSVAEILLDGKRAAVLGWQPYAATIAATPGKHSVAVKIVSTPHNIFGPFHNPTKPRKNSWPAAWASFPEHQPAGAQYDIIDYGLDAPPVISAVTRP